MYKSEKVKLFTRTRMFVVTIKSFIDVLHSTVCDNSSSSSQRIFTSASSSSSSSSVSGSSRYGWGCGSVLSAVSLRSVGAELWADLEERNRGKFTCKSWAFACHVIQDRTWASIDNRKVLIIARALLTCQTVTSCDERCFTEWLEKVAMSLDVREGSLYPSYSDRIGWVL